MLDVKQVMAGMTSLLNKGTRHIGKPWNSKFRLEKLKNNKLTEKRNTLLA